MHTSPEWTKILLWFGAGHSIFMAFTPLTIPRGNRLANRLFSGILVIFGFSIFLHTLSGTDFLITHPHFSKIEPALVFLLGPLFYFYVRALTDAQFRLEKKQWLHFGPFFLCVLYLMPYYLQSSEEKVRHIVEEHQDFCVHCLVTYWLVMMQMLGYLIAITKTLLKFNQAMRDS